MYKTFILALMASVAAAKVFVGDLTLDSTGEVPEVLPFSQWVSLFRNNETEYAYVSVKEMKRREAIYEANVAKILKHNAGPSGHRQASTPV